MPSNVTRAGDRALLVELPDAAAHELHAFAAAQRRREGVLACIVGQQSLYVVFDHEPSIEELVPAEETGVPAVPRRHSIEVSFAPQHSSDLPEFLDLVRLTRPEFLERLAAIRLTARYLGFRAGFAYLDGWPAEWSMPRRRTSRPVPRGSFAIAGNTAGFYPIDTPGGWNILGRSDARFWDPQRQQPNLIAPGDEIAIVPVERQIAPCATAESIGDDVAGIEIVRNAQFTRVVGVPEWSRVGYGVAPGGAFDPDSAAVANMLVGNEPDAPLLECAMNGPQIHFRQRAVVAWVGAGSDLVEQQAIDIAAREELSIGPIRNGLRGWLAVRSNGRRSLPPRVNRQHHGDRKRIQVMAGPHQTPLRSIACEVTPQLDRVGIRLRPLQRIEFQAEASLPSCGMQFGTIQLHPDGTLVAMGPDHPVTGGYVQPLTVKWEERWKLAQLMPGERMEFVCE